MSFLEKLCPNRYVNSIFEIDFSELKLLGIQGIIVDLDNTLVPWDIDEVEEKLINWFKELKTQGFSICILSNNNSRRRVDIFSDRLEIPAIHKANKPFKQGFFGALGKINTTPEKTAVIGDQIFTDVFGGNRMGGFTILVRPLVKREFIGTKVIRQFEKLVISHLKKRGMLKR
jgi:HAD superfamily phosphatase (TIGR01668 family)